MSASAATTTGQPGGWQDTPLARIEVLALLQSLNADLLSHDSATLVLDRWCAGHAMAAPAVIFAERVHGEEVAPTAEQRALLGVGPDQPVRARHVRLMCGAHVLSEADNWYVPARLTAEMNQTLDTSDTAFGRVVGPLHFRRRTLSAELLWSPLPQGWESGVPLPPAPPGQALAIPAHVLRHTALLNLPDGTPFSLVVETYGGAVLDFPQPGLSGSAR